MGVAGCVGLVKKRGHYFRRPIGLKNTSLVIDVTEGMYWFLKKHYLGIRTDLAGWSQVELGSFFRQFFKRLKERRVRPIIVYNGARVNESLYGTLAAKSNYLEGSCNAALRRLQRGQNTIQMPDLCLNALKEIINEFNFDQVHQSCFESHFVIAKLANENRCPVLTSHSDFIFLPLKYGFIWFDDFPDVKGLPSSSEAPIQTILYSNEGMLNHFNLDQSYAGALTSLNVILRDDFAAAHCDAVNEVLSLDHGIRLQPDARLNGLKTRRLIQVLERWPRNLTSFEMVYHQITNSRAGWNLKRDFDGIWTSYDTKEPFGQMSSQFITEHFLPASQISDLNGALTRRECVASFMMNLKQKKNFNRQQVEDLNTYRSSFSLSDRVRQYLTAKYDLQQQPSLYDRIYNGLEFRNLLPMGDGTQNKSMSKELLFEMFHFDEKRLQELAGLLAKQLQIGLENSRRLSLIMLLARYAIRVGFRDSFDNSSGGSNDRGSASSLSTSARSNPIARAYLAEEYLEKFFVALVNSFVYHLNEQQGDIQPQEIPAEHRVMRNHLKGFRSQPLPSVSRDSNLNHKHMLELLNQTISAYKEINSLYNFAGPNVLVCKYYDGVLIFTIMSKWSQNLRGYLLLLSQDITELIRP